MDSYRPCKISLILINLSCDPISSQISLLSFLIYHLCHMLSERSRLLWILFPFIRQMMKLCEQRINVQKVVHCRSCVKLMTIEIWWNYRSSLIRIDWSVVESYLWSRRCRKNVWCAGYKKLTFCEIYDSCRIYYFMFILWWFCLALFSREDKNIISQSSKNQKCSDIKILPPTLADRIWRLNYLARNHVMKCLRLMYWHVANNFVSQICKDSLDSFEKARNRCLHDHTQFRHKHTTQYVCSRSSSHALLAFEIEEEEVFQKF